MPAASRRGLLLSYLYVFVYSSITFKLLFIATCLEKKKKKGGLGRGTFTGFFNLGMLR
jgi:hypothetical protein